MDKLTTAQRLHARIQVRAYYLALNGMSGSSVDHWLEAELVELTLSVKRRAAAAKGAATRLAKATVPAALKLGRPVRRQAVH